METTLTQLSAEIDRDKKELESKREALKVLRRVEQRAKWEADRAAESKLIEESKSKLAKFYHLERNGRFEKGWNIAWELGHSSGFEEVENYFHDLVELIRV